jgi:hypothetical protein
LSRLGLRLGISENNLITTPTSPVDLPLHPNLGILAQRRRALLCQAHEAAIEARRLRIGRRLGSRHQSLRRRKKRLTEILHMDC